MRALYLELFYLEHCVLRMSSWTELSKLPSSDFSNTTLIKVNASQFIQVSNEYSRKYQGVDQGIDVFDIEHNKWNKWRDFPDKIQTVYDILIAFDTKNQVLYLQLKSQLIKMDIKGNTTKIIEDVQRIGGNSRAIVINDELHVFGGGSNKHHLI